jgi:exodeoxyribonuclease VII small subunit
VPKKSTNPPLALGDTLPYEEAFKRLEALVESLESGEVSLADLVTKFEEGHKLLKICQQHLQAAGLKIEQLKLDPAGGPPAFTPFDEEKE